MAVRDYDSITKQQYFELTQFDLFGCQPLPYDHLVQKEAELGEMHIDRIEISRALAARLLAYIERSSLSTRGPVPDLSSSRHLSMSHTVFTTRFSMHLIEGSRGGWFVLEHGGREPILKDEFIEFGAKRKSGGRKHRYRRSLSGTEQNQIDYLKSCIPTLEQLYRMMMRKCPTEVKHLSVWFGERHSGFGA